MFVVFGLVLLAVADVAYSIMGTYIGLLAVRALQGLGVAFTVIATIALVNELATDESRGSNMGVFNTFRLVGFGTGPLVAGGVITAGPYTLPVGGLTVSGFDAAFYIAAIAASVSALIVLFLVSDPVELEASTDDDQSLRILSQNSDHLLDPIFTLGVASLFMAIGIALFSAIQPTINARLHQGAALFGIEFAAFVFAQVLLQTPIGKASDRFGRRPFIIWGLLLLVPATLAQGFVTVPWQMITARFVQGAAGAMVFAPALALAGDLAREGSSGSQLSVLTMSFGLGTAIGPLASGFLIRYGFVTQFALGSVAAALGALLVYTQVEETVGHASGASPSSGMGESTQSCTIADD